MRKNNRAIPKKLKGEIVDAWLLLMRYADMIDEGRSIPMTDEEMLVIGQVMNTKDRYDQLKQLTKILYPKSPKIYPLSKIIDGLKKERDKHNKLKTDVEEFLISYIPEPDQIDVNSNVEVSLSDLIKLRMSLLRLN